MIGIGPASLGLPWGQVWFQWFPLLICQISSCHARSVPAAWFCKQTLADRPPPGPGPLLSPHARQPPAGGQYHAPCSLRRSPLPASLETSISCLASFGL